MPEKIRKRLDFIINILYVGAVIGIIYVAFKLVSLVLPFVIAFIMVALLQPLIRFINNKMKINRKIVSVMIMALLYVSVGCLIFWLVTQLVFLSKDIFIEFPQYYVEKVNPSLMKLMSILNEWLGGILPEQTVIQDNLMNSLQNLVVSISQKGIAYVTGFINTIPGFFLGLLFTIVLSFFISLQYDVVMGFMKNQLPDKAKESLANIREILKDTIFKYLKAAIILMGITFVELFIGFLIIRTPTPLISALGIAIFDALPVLGTGGIMIPWVIIELVQANFGYAIGLMVLYGTVTIVRNILEPKVVGDQLGIHPIVSLMAVYIGFRLFGAIGMIAFPILAQILLVMHQRGNIKIYMDKK